MGAVPQAPSSAVVPAASGAATGPLTVEEWGRQLGSEVRAKIEGEPAERVLSPSTRLVRSGPGRYVFEDLGRVAFRGDGKGGWEPVSLEPQLSATGPVAASYAKTVVPTSFGRDGGPQTAAVGDDLLRPGPWARESVPSSGPGRITQAERDLLNPIGDAHGCHSCGAPTAGTKSGNWIGDHQPVSRTVPPGTPQVLYPQCQACSNDQGLWIINLIRQGKL